MQLDWNDLKFFLAVAEHKSIKKAAESLRVNHTTVMRRIDALEYRLECTLFVRSKGSVELTDVAEKMLDSVRAVSNQVVALERQLIGQSDRVSGDVLLTLPPFLATHLLFLHLPQFYKNYPGVNLQIAATNEFVDLSKRQADIAIRLSNNPEAHLNTHLFGKKIADVQMARYTAVDSKRAAPLIAWDNSVDFEKWMEKCDAADSAVRCVISEPLVQIHAVISGIGDAILPCFVGDREKALRKAGNSFAGFEAWVVTHKDMRNAEHIKAVKEFIYGVFEAEKNRVAEA